MSIYHVIDRAEAARQYHRAADGPPLDPPADRAAVLRHARAYLDAIPPAIEGQNGDAHTFRVCCKLVRGFTLNDDEALDVLAPWNATCAPPWTERELSAKLDTARRNGTEPIGGRLQRDEPAPVTAPPEARVRLTDPLTDVGAAERFARAHGDDVRFDHRRQRWLLWAGHRWTPDTDSAILRIAIEFARSWQREALDISDRDRREKVITFAVRLERRESLMNMLALARVLKPIADAGDGWDADPWLLGVPNGVVDLRAGTLRAGQRDDQITMAAAVPFDASAPCPRWERFVREIMAGDPDLASFLHRAVGYSLSGVTTEQVLFLLYGVGSNGKGSFTNTLQFILGDHSWNMPFSTLEMRDRGGGIPNDLAALAGRRFVIASETNDGSRLNEARVKALTGCDPVTARFLHSEFFTFEPVAKFWLSVNHKPVVRDDSYGFWRRLRLVPFTQRFDVNPSLVDELRAEASGILAWAVRGCLAWQRDGLQAPAVVIDATREYERDSDPLAGFLAEACDVAQASQVGASEIFDHYKRWAELHGLTERERLNSSMFGRKFAERFVREHSRDGRVYKGVARRGL